MPKQTFKIESFHGGINSSSNPRDLDPNQSPVMENVSIDSVGTLKPMSGFTSVDGSGDSRPMSNYGLYVMSSDRKIDGTESDETLIFNFNRHDNKIDIKDSSGWNTDKITLDGGSFTISGISYPTSANSENITHTANANIVVGQTIHGGTADANFPDNAFISNINSSTIFKLSTSTINTGSSQTVQARKEVKPIYYSSDGVVRVSDKNFNASPQWFGYIEDERFDGINGDSGALGWANEPQSVASPTVGKCLISVPFESSDTNGVNSAKGEYIGNVIDGTAAANSEVAEGNAVNLRVGIQHSEKINRVASQYTTAGSGASDADKTTNPYSFINQNVLVVGATNSDTFTIINIFDNELSSDDTYTINDTSSFAFPVFITSGRQYNDLKSIEVYCGTKGSGSTNIANTYGWKINKDEIVSDCWNLIVCAKNTNDFKGDGSCPDWGSPFNFFQIEVIRKTNSSNDDPPTFTIGHPISINVPSPITSFPPGEYTFHYSWLYDRDNKQESLPYKFGDIDTEYSGTCNGFMANDDAQALGSVSTTQIKLASGESSDNNFFNGTKISIVAGAGAGDTKDFSSYNGTTKVYTISGNFSTQPDATSEYQIFKTGQATIMTDSTNSFVTDNLINRVVQNTTDKSEGIITDNDTTSVTVGALLYGTDNDWDVEYASSSPYAMTGDNYLIKKSNVNKINIVRNPCLFNFDVYTIPKPSGTYGLNKRITGSRLYYKLKENDNYFLIGELDFINKGFKFFPESDTLAYDMQNTSNTTGNLLGNTAYISGITPDSANTIDTFKSINGFSSEAATLDAQYKTAVVHGRRVYIGNVKQNGVRHPDRIIKSRVNKFDTFPDNLGSVDVVVRDGEDIVKLETYADRILQYKQRSLYIINVSESIDFLEDTYKNKGVAYPYHVIKTDYGVSWFNKLGVYIYDGKNVHNLLEKNGIQLISTDSSSGSWKSFITDSSSSGDDYLPAQYGIERAMIGYIPNKREILISNSQREILIYNLVYKAWTKGINKLTSANFYTNFSLDANEDLFHITSTDLDIDTWSSDPIGDGNFTYVTSDIDFGEPGVNKKVYKVYVTYKNTDAVTNVTVKYDTNGRTTFDKTFLDGTNFLSNALADPDTTNFVQAELKPTTSSDVNNIKSFALKFTSSTNTVPSAFEINDITIVFRMKRVK